MCKHWIPFDATELFIRVQQKVCFCHPCCSFSHQIAVVPLKNDPTDWHKYSTTSVFACAVSTLSVDLVYVSTCICSIAWVKEPGRYRESNPLVTMRTFGAAEIKFWHPRIYFFAGFVNYLYFFIVLWIICKK